MASTAHPYCLVICQDGPQGLYTVYFVNQGHLDVIAARITSNAYCSVDDELLETSEGVKQLGTIAAGAHAVVEVDDEGAFDFAIGFDAAVETEEGTNKVSFSVSKYLPMYTPPDARTPLGKPGWVVWPNE